VLHFAALTLQYARLQSFSHGMYDAATSFGGRLVEPPPVWEPKCVLIAKKTRKVEDQFF
jgi:hypothetical protein